MEGDLFASLLFAAAAILVGMVAAAEMALTSVDRSAVRRRSAAGESRARLVDSLLENATQFWLTSMLVKTVGLLAAGVAVGRVFTVSAGLVTVVLATVASWLALGAAQIVGRSLVDDPETVALRLAPFARGMMTVLSPLTFLLYRTGIRISGDDVDEPEEALFLSEDGLRRLMQVNDERSDIDERAKDMIAGILEMDDTVVREVMVPRIDMVTLPVDASLHAALEAIFACGHSRIPVYEENVDVIVGLLYAKDLLHCVRDTRSDISIRELLRPAHFVPASKKVNQLLRELQQQRIHLAMVVDEYGGIAGLVTLEDIIEEIFGEIQDEYDVNEAFQYQAAGEHAYLINAMLDMDSLAELLGVDLADEDADTLGGLIYSRLGHVPEVGESIELDGWRLQVLSLDGRRIEQVRADQILLPAHEADVDDVLPQPTERKSAFNSSGLTNP